MKRIVTLLLALALTVAASTAFATSKGYSDTAVSSATLTIGTLVFKLSKNVLMAYESETNFTGYSIGAYHNKGTKTFASSSGDSKIFEAAKTGMDIPDAPVGTASANFATGWTSL